MHPKTHIYPHFYTPYEVLINMYPRKYHIIPVFDENSVGLDFLQSVSYIKPILTHEKNICFEKKWPKCHF